MTTIPHRQYADAVLRELNTRASTFAQYTLRSVYLGGGTPSLWQPAELRRVLKEVLQTLVHDAEVEITVEVNPGTVSPWLFDQLLEAGVNRISIGIQSLDEEILRLLTRLHTSKMAREAVALARQAGFVNISGDLMFGVPHQTLAHHLDQLAQVLELDLTHLSTYGLSLSPGSPLKQAGLKPAEDDLQAEMMEAGRKYLQEAGFAQYEVSNYSRPGFPSVHNTLVWEGKPYLGLGAAAHSMGISGRSHIRVANPYLVPYLGAPILSSVAGPIIEGASVDIVPEPMARYEVFLLGLRTTQGVSRGEYKLSFGADPLEHFGDALAELAALGLITVEPTRISPTPKGIWYADELALRLIP